MDLLDSLRLSGTVDALNHVLMHYTDETLLVSTLRVLLLLTQNGMPSHRFHNRQTNGLFVLIQ